MCCVVFDIDGMLFEFLMNLLYIETNKILRIISSIFNVFFAFYAITNTYNFFFFFRKNFFSFHFMSYAIFNITQKNIEILKSAPSLTG